MGDAVLILVFGMGSVGCFLLLLVAIMQLLVRCLPVRERTQPPSSSNDVAADQTRLVAVIQAAIQAYDADRRSSQ